MNATLQKTLVIAVGVIVVLFLLLDGGAMAEATINTSVAANSASVGSSWIWIIPTLLIFGLGFLLAWFLFGVDATSNSREGILDLDRRDLDRRIDMSKPNVK